MAHLDACKFRPPLCLALVRLSGLLDQLLLCARLVVVGRHIVAEDTELRGGCRGRREDAEANSDAWTGNPDGSYVRWHHRAAPTQFCHPAAKTLTKVFL